MQATGGQWTLALCQAEERAWQFRPQKDSPMYEAYMDLKRQSSTGFSAGVSPGLCSRTTSFSGTSAVSEGGGERWVWLPGGR